MSRARFLGGTTGRAAHAGAMLLKCAGAVSGTVEVDDGSTVGALVAELERRACVPPGGLKVIAGGKTLGGAALFDETLARVGFGDKTRLVVSRTAPNPTVEAHAARAARETARRERLDRIASAAEAIASRAGHTSRRRFVLETQAGTALAGIPESDRVALTQGLALHRKGRQLADAGELDDAIDLLELAERAFAEADPALTDKLDNLPILLLDLAWFAFRRRRPADAPDAIRRLRACREGFTRAHGPGPDLARLRSLHGGFRPELGLYVRLELLEGVAAYSRGDVPEARERLLAASRALASLRLSDDAMASLASMGFTRKEAARGLRFCGGDVAAAAAFITEHRANAAAAAAAAAARDRSDRRRRRFGKTPAGRLVDEDALRALEEMGYPRNLAAAALRATENAVQTALDALALRRDALEEDAVAAADAWARRRRGRGRGRGRVREDGRETRADPDGERSKRARFRSDGDDVGVTALVEMGFDEGAARRALSRTGGDVDAAAAVLLGGPGAGGPDFRDSEPGDPGDADADDGDDDGSNSSGDDSGDEEAEAELAGGVASGDGLAEYDLDLALEGDAVAEYLALCDAAGADIAGAANANA